VLAAAATNFKNLFITHNAAYHLNNGQMAVLKAFQDALVFRITNIGDNTLRNELMSLCNGSGWARVPENPVSGSLSYKLRTSRRMIGKKYQEGLPAGHPDEKGRKPMGALKSAMTINSEKLYQDAIKPALDLANAASAADKTEALAILTGDNTGTGEWAASTINGWFSRSKIGPVSFPKVSLPRQCALFIYSLVGCGDTARFTGKQLLGTQNVVAGSIPVFTTASLGFGSKGYSKDDRSLRGNLIIKYAPAKLQSAVTAAKNVLTAGPAASPAFVGGFLIAGVLSGKEHESDHPIVEHSILIFAVSGKQFLFWDPDVGSANILKYGAQLGVSLGLLVHDQSEADTPRMTTGEDFADLFDIDGNGFHRQNPNRHRYQVLTLASV
jgi:hypothetical protein